jgi:hypothetical protein
MRHRVIWYASLAAIDERVQGPWRAWPWATGLTLHLLTTYALWAPSSLDKAHAPHRKRKVLPPGRKGPSGYLDHFQLSRGSPGGEASDLTEPLSEREDEEEDDD